MKTDPKITPELAQELVQALIGLCTGWSPSMKYGAAMDPLDHRTKMNAAFRQLQTAGIEVGPPTEKPAPADPATLATDVQPGAVGVTMTEEEEAAYKAANPDLPSPVADSSGPAEKPKPAPKKKAGKKAGRPKPAPIPK